VGGGIFGCYAALYLSGKGHRICLVESEGRLFTKASIVNQARLHSGYHYPRSVATALMSDDNKARFTEEHRPFINFEFEKYYAIDQYASFTDAAQFERFCQFIGIRCERVHRHPLFNFERMEALYLTTEYSFDPMLIAGYYQQKVEETPAITIALSTLVHQGQQQGTEWSVELESRRDGQRRTLHAAAVINATYSGSNAVNRSFGLQEIQLMHEIAEIAFVTSPQFKDVGITVMDGQFGSLMPYGKTGMLSLSSVAYTHHQVSYENLPQFDCQARQQTCRPEAPAICTECPARPASGHHKMMTSMRQYLSDRVQLDYLSSSFTVKSKLKANFVDDGRPTEIFCLHRDPDYFCIFAGKINSIYEIEKVV
jgi:2-polyprenyl-6-methoxyphenol hydroxylase-like FAD-dependent oxidoreductase